VTIVRPDEVKDFGPGFEVSDAGILKPMHLDAMPVAAIVY